MKSGRLAIWRIYLIGASCCGAITTAVALGLVSPAIQHAHRNAALEQTLRDRRQTIAALSADLATSHRQRDDMRASLRRSTLTLAPSTEINARLASIAILAGEHGLSLDEIRAGSPAEGPNVEMLPIILRGAGSYPNCARFLHHLREKYPDTLIKALDTTAGSKGASSAFRFELNWCTKKGNGL